MLVEGPGEALVSIHDPDELYVSTVNAATVGLAVILAAVLFLIAPYISKLYEDPQLKELLWALTPLPLLSALTASPMALLQSRLQFERSLFDRPPGWRSAEYSA